MATSDKLHPEPMSRWICIHAHFYQPARENPWLERIEIQDSAAPAHDWNERVSRECYAPNAASRILDADGNIEEIVNNYSRISFNFGPTLLSWLEEHDPETYQAILEADRESARRFGGHGNALAQPWNHMILPLARREDARTQVIWGLEDFRTRFRREPEGMWLPEAAVDTPTLEILAEEGILFAILAPHQARRVRKIGSQGWTDVTGARIDPSRPYLAKLPSGHTITLFFYDGPISRAVAFERLLENGSEFRSRLMSGFDPAREGSQLVHIATDGETYGHHHIHGDMALAWVLREIERDPKVTLTNYGAFLAKKPPQWEVDIIEDSSWSCMHGVERWRQHCGCETGGQAGWHQRWRRPLREALNGLRERILAIFDSTAVEVFVDPEKAREGYVHVLIDRSDQSVDRYLGKYLSVEPTAENVTRALRLLEMERHAQLMFTSCGWFFSDVGGIETVQVMQYAARAIQLAEELSGEKLEAEFVEQLREAQGNTPGAPNGAVVWEKYVLPARVDLARVAAQEGIRSIWEKMQNRTTVAAHEVIRERVTGIESGRYRAAVGSVEVRSTLTRERARFSFAFLDPGDSLFLQGGVRPVDDDLTGTDHVASALRDALSDGDLLRAVRLLERTYPEAQDAMRLLFRDEQRELVERIRHVALEEAEGMYRQLYDRYVPLVRMHARLAIPLPRTLGAASELVLNVSLRRELEAPVPSPDAVGAIVQQANKAGVALDSAMLGFLYEKRVAEAAARLRRRPDDALVLEELRSLLVIVGLLPFAVDLWTAQNSYDRIRREWLPDVAQRAGAGDPEASARLEAMREIGRRLQFREE